MATNYSEIRHLQDFIDDRQAKGGWLRSKLNSWRDRLSMAWHTEVPVLIADLFALIIVCIVIGLLWGKLISG